MASTKLTRTLSTPTNDKKCTFSMWIKKSKTGSEQTLFTGNTSSNRDGFRFEGSLDVIRCFLNGATSADLRTNRVFRDTSAWYHIVMAIDTTQATASDRMKLYINGVQETSFSTSTYPSQNFVLGFNSARLHAIGIDGYDNNSPYDGSMSHIHFIDGTAYDATAFGSTDSTTGEWKINTSPSVTYGTNGFFILKDGNSVTDQSGNSNNFTVGGGTLTKTEDSPSNVFATINPLQWNGNITNASLSNGNTTYTSSATGTDYSWFYSTLGATSGKWYAEFKCVDSGGAMIGIGGNDFATSSYFTANAINSDGIGYYYNGSVFVKDVSQGSLTAISNNDIVSVAMDLDNSLVYWYLNGSVQNSGTGMSIPTSNTGFYHFVVGDASSTPTPTIQANFGNGYFGTTAVSSAGTNASDNGIFEYDVPTGYTALSTKGLNL